jgi:hypothetical protein
MATASQEAGRGLEIEIGSFLEVLIAASDAPRSVAQRQSILQSLVRWVQDQHLAVDDISDVHLVAFLPRRSRSRKKGKKERATLRRFHPSSTARDPSARRPRPPRSPTRSRSAISRTSAPIAAWRRTRSSSLPKRASVPRIGSRRTADSSWTRLMRRDSRPSSSIASCGGRPIGPTPERCPPIVPTLLGVGSSPVTCRPPARSPHVPAVEHGRRLVTRGD